MSDPEAAHRENNIGVEMQATLWSAVIKATQNETHGDARKLILPALNEMFDISTTRLVAIQSHPPLFTFVMLAIFSIAAAGLTGHGMAGFERPLNMHLIGYSALACLVFTMISDIEYPRFGFVRLDAPHQLIQDMAQQTMPNAPN